MIKAPETIESLEERKRRSIIAPVLFGLTIFMLTAFLVVTYVYFFGNFTATTVRSIWILSAGIIISTYSLKKVRTKSSKVPSLFICGFLYIGCTYTLLMYGPYHPQSLLFLAFLVSFSVTTLGSKVGWLCLTISTISILGSEIGKQLGVIPLYRQWDITDIGAFDSLAYAATLLLFYFTSHRINAETNSALLQAAASERALLKERDQLEATVVERTQELRQEQYSRVAELNKLAELGRQSSEITHDLVNQLHGVRLNLAIAQSDAATKANKELQEILAESNRAAERMEQFLRSVRRSANKASDMGGTIRPLEEITEAIRTLEHRARKAKVLVTTSVQGTSRLNVDRSAFYRVVLNLVSNAIDSYDIISDSRERHVEVTFSRVHRNYILTVSDNGCGIPKNIRSRVFEPFFTTKSLDKGTGIGLSITKDLVKENLGGSILLESSDNQGTTVTITLPGSLAQKNGHDH